MLKTNDPAAIDQDHGRNGIDFIPLVIGITYRCRSLPKNRIKTVAHANNVLQLFVGWCRTPIRNKPVAACWPDNDETLRAIFLDQPLENRTLGIALRALVRPEEDEHDLSLQLIRVRQARIRADAVLQSRRRLAVQILEGLGV